MQEDVVEDPIDVEEARRRVLARIRPLASEPVALADALDRVLASDVVAEQDVRDPPAPSRAAQGQPRIG